MQRFVIFSNLSNLGIFLGTIFRVQRTLFVSPRRILRNARKNKFFTGNRLHSQAEMLNELDDLRIKQIKPLIPPQILIEDIPAPPSTTRISEARQRVTDILHGKDDRLVVIIGPCSIHDPISALEYAHRLVILKEELKNQLEIVMRVYFEKPRTTVGWKGLINDPFLDGSFQINKGLRIARQLLVDINNAGLPCGLEFLDTISPQYVADLTTWGAIGNLAFILHIY